MHLLQAMSVIIFCDANSLGSAHLKQMMHIRRLNSHWQVSLALITVALLIINSVTTILLNEPLIELYS